MKKHQSYKCNTCGCLVEVQEVGNTNAKLSCCNEEMEMVTKDLTQVNLMKAFAGESMARNRYEYYAKIAQKEGFRDIAEHFQRAANKEKVHVKIELRLYNKMTIEKDFEDTIGNLKEAIEGESYENEFMYPEFAAIAKEEGHKEAARILAGIGKIEIEHENMFRMLLKRLEQGREFLSDDKDEEWICEVCGHIHRGKKPPKTCPVCNHPIEYQSRLNSKK